MPPIHVHLHCPKWATCTAIRPLSRSRRPPSLVPCPWFPCVRIPRTHIYIEGWKGYQARGRVSGSSPPFHRLHCHSSPFSNRLAKVIHIVNCRQFSPAFDLPSLLYVSVSLSLATSPPHQVKLRPSLSLIDLCGLVRDSILFSHSDVQTKIQLDLWNILFCPNQTNTTYFTHNHLTHPILADLFDRRTSSIRFYVLIASFIFCEDQQKTLWEGKVWDES